jgi:hypothetical protein
MTKEDLFEALEDFEDDHIVICKDECGGWDNIQKVEQDSPGIIAIVFGGGPVFTN